MINKSNNLYIHIGLPKTGTTFLQKKVFSNLSENIIFNPKIFNELYELYLNKTSEDKILIDKINECKNFIKNNKNKKILISNEGWSHEEYSFKFEKKLLFLSKHFKYAKILLVFRDIKDWIISMYLQSFQQGNIQEFNDFITTKKTNMFKNCRTTNYLPKLDISEINYDSLKSFVIKYFDNKPLFLNYDNNLKNLINELENNFLNEKLNMNEFTKNIKINKSLSGLSIKIILYFKIIFPNFFRDLMYDKNIPLYKNSKIKNSFITWIKIRNFFQNYVDNIIYIDLNIKKNYLSLLKKYF